MVAGAGQTDVRDRRGPAGPPGLGFPASRPVPGRPYKAVVLECPRCGGAHKDLRFEPLSRMTDVWTHWAPCPANGQPIMAQSAARPGGERLDDRP